MNEHLEEMQALLARVRTEIGKVIIGQEGVINQALITILTGKHALVEGVPGVGKTLLVRTLACVLGADFNRIQFTPDLMPADIVGTNVYNFQQNSFNLVKGPVFTTFLLADEINRAPAKTQSALLQAMQERQVSIDRDTLSLSPYFTVFATQNPIEFEGTYPLPEAQKDRFLMKIDMDCPVLEEEVLLAQRTLGSDAPEDTLASGAVQPVMELESMGELRPCFQAVTLREELLRYTVDVVRRSRNTSAILVGAGPRATQALLLAARVHAVIEGRDFVTPDDIKALAAPVLGHRLILRPEYEIEGMTNAEVIEQLLQEVAVPR